MNTLDRTKINAERHAGKVALVTGGSSGIGLAAAKRLALERAKVYITGRRQGELDAAIAEIGHHATAIQGDISKNADLDRVFEIIGSAEGRLDILLANAGGGEFVPVGEITEAQFHKYFDINVKGTLFTVQKALPLMRSGSSIVITGSIAGIKAFPAFGVYAATKAALRSFVRTASVDLKGRGIRVNIVAPGTVVTPAYKSELGLSEEQIEQFVAQASEVTPLGRPGTADEIASAMSFLASDEASYITAIELVVDGGQSQI
jgi:NAD(P)-dependent dehydrogenase (short-subunit alcohol dehydrogenase family)